MTRGLLRFARNDEALCGASGSNRCQTRKCQIAAQHDREAIDAWLVEYAHKETTHRAYKKESERLLLWAVAQKRKAFSSLDRQDFEEYFAFLLNPSPKDLWCGPKGKHFEWKPFVGPLSQSAQKTAIAIIDSLLNYLVQAAYLDFNPISLMRRQLGRFSPTIQTERMLNDTEWSAFLGVLQELPEDLDKARLRFLVALLFLLGLRIQEVENHVFGDFRQIAGDWWFFVTGKGDKKAKIPVNEDLIAEMMRFRRWLRLSELPNPDERYPLIPSWRSNGALSTRQMSALIKSLALKTGLAGLEKLSPHWLRHHSATMQDKAGVRFTHIKANHRHENEQTTRRYVHSLDKERHEDMQKLRLAL
ncbi:MAG: tyrosine-type recombinase/integrase [Myxococcota bacterium]